MPRALITGITGQDGSYLAEFLLAKGYEVGGLVRQSSTTNLWRIQDFQHRINLFSGDLLDTSMIDAALRDFEPHEVYNLGALSIVQSSFDYSVHCGDVTGLGAARVLDSVRRVCPDARFFQASTSEMFGKPREVPQTEETGFYPRSPYGVAKVYAHWMTVNHREAHGLHASCGITFNHESPRRGVEFVTRKITSSVARIVEGSASELRLGNLDARRDWGAAEEYVDAMWRMTQRDEPGDFVLSTGVTHSVREFCEIAFARVGLDYHDYVVIDEAFFRPLEERQLVGDPSKARDELGWTARLPFVDLVHSMVDGDLALRGRPVPQS